MADSRIPGRAGRSARGETGRFDLVAAVRYADRDHGLFERGARIVVGVSGGGDSVALLCALHAYAPERSLTLHVAHLDHQLRPESTDDAAAVAGLADAMGLHATLAAHDVRALARETGRGIEDAARVARYAHLAACAQDLQASAVAVAHTFDDQAETVLMNLLRGAGLDGLRGMSHRARYPVSGDVVRALTGRVVTTTTAWPPPLLRPLLSVTRRQARDYLREQGIAWRHDATNFDRRFLRSRVRHEFLPMLEDANPRVRDALFRTSAAVASDLVLVDALVEDAWTRMATPARDRVSFALAAWREQSPPLQRRLLRRAVAELRDGTLDLGWDHVTLVLRLGADGRVGQAVSLPGGLRASLTYDALEVCRLSASVQEPRRSGTPVRIAVPGRIVFAGTWTIVADIVHPRPDVAISADDRWTVVLDVPVPGAELAVRGRLPGDRLQPRGMGGRHKSLQDLFVDAKVPRELRDEWPVIVRGETVLWVPGIRPGLYAAPSPDAPRWMRLSVLPPARVTGQR